MNKIFKTPVVQSAVKRLGNKGTILALAGLLVTLLIQLGVKVDSEKVMAIVQTVCSILIILGVMNDPTNNDKAYVPYVSDKFIDKSSNIEEPQKTNEEVSAEKTKEVSNIKDPVEEVKAEEVK